jgi:hypothetical protein
MTYLAPVTEVSKLMLEGWAISTGLVVSNNRGCFVLMHKG